MLLIINTGLWLNKRRQNCEEPKWRAKCPCLTFSIAMSCLDAKISLVPSINSQSHIKDTYAYTTDIRAIFFQNTSKRRNAAICIGTLLMFVVFPHDKKAEIHSCSPPISLHVLLIFVLCCTD